MSTFFVDTSAVAKRYLAEIGSAWVISWIEPPAGNVAVVAELTTVEMFTLIARRQREGTLSQPSATILQNDFLVHIETEYLTVPLDRSVLGLARTLTGKYPLRTLDALQLASALRATAILNEPMTFVSADRNLLNAALAEGFNVDDPNVHP